METVKLNFHLELHATLVCNLNSGLCLELQVFCSSFTQELDRYTAAARLLRGLELIRHTPWPFMSLLESTQLPRTATFDSQTHIGVFFNRCSAGQHLCF